MMYTLYSGDNCPRCSEVKKYMDSKGIQYQEKNVRKDMDAMAFLKSRGFTSIPQVFQDDTLVCGWTNYKEVL